MIEAMTLDDVKAAVAPYGSFNEVINFSTYDGYYGDVCLHICNKVFIVAMMCYYKQLGLESLASKLNLVLSSNWIEDTDYHDSFNELEDGLISNGEAIIESIETYGWDLNLNCIDGVEYDYSGPSNLSRCVRDSFSELINTFEWIYKGPKLKGEKRDENYDDYYSEGYIALSLISNQKLGRYMYYMQSHPADVFEKDDAIHYLTSMLSYPFNGNGYYHSALIGDTYYIGWLTGWMNEMWDKSARDIDYYFPLYAYWLDKILDLAFIRFDIDAFCESNPPELPPDDDSDLDCYDFDYDESDDEEEHAEGIDGA